MPHHYDARSGLLDGIVVVEHRTAEPVIKSHFLRNDFGLHTGSHCYRYQQ
jgi:hypothetical protein